MGIAYEKDIVAWANEQASFIRAGRFELLDLEHIAEEIEDVGKSEQRELENRMAILWVHLNKRQKSSVGFYAKPTALRLSLGFRLPIFNHTKMALFTRTW